MIRAVYDTNIIISGSLWSGMPRRALTAAAQGHVKVLISEAMLDELNEVIRRPKFIEHLALLQKDAADLVGDLLEISEIIEIESVSNIVPADPDDDAVIACAVGGRA